MPEKKNHEKLNWTSTILQGQKKKRISNYRVI